MSRPLASDDRISLAIAAALFLILFGARLALIARFGSATPFMDEWDGDWGALLARYLDGTLTPGTLASPFNEHRILFTRLTVLSIFAISGYWDVVLQMIVNAALGSLEVVAVGFALTRVLSGAGRRAAFAALCLVNVVPFSYDVILFGFNTHFYLLPILALAGLWLTVDSRSWSARWLTGVLCGAASFFCLASGALTLAAMLVTQVLQMARGRGRGCGLREWLGIAALAAATAVMLVFVPHVAESDAFRSRSPAEFISALGALAGWPAGAFGLVLLAPSALFVRRVLVERPETRDPRWFNVAALGWVAAQIAALAFGRGQAPLQNRYQDILMLALTIHFVSVLWLVETQPKDARARRLAYLGLAAWIAMAGATLARKERHLPRDIEAWSGTIETGGENVRSYLVTGDGDFLSGPPTLTIPYVRSDRLRAYLDSPEADIGLPPQLTLRRPPHPWVEAFKTFVLRFAFGWIGLGMAALFLAAKRPSARRVAGGGPAPLRETSPTPS